MAPRSKFIRDIANEIELKSGAKIKFAQVTSEKWITERDMSTMKAIKLRTAKDTKNDSVVELQQFNPSFFLKDPSNVHCRFPKCSATMQRLKPNHSSEKIKQDLFLCCAHREKLTSEVTKRCVKENVIVNVASFKHEDFNGYTSLIGILEKAFVQFQKQASILSTTDHIIAEVLLNTRNFLVITNALLNPNGDNEPTVLGSYLTMFLSFLSCMNDPQKRESLKTALSEISKTIWLYFSVNYSWIVLANPGGRVGGGLGLLLGFIGGTVFGFTGPGIFAATLVGLVAGILIGSGSYDWSASHLNMQARQEMVQRHQEFVARLHQQTETSTRQPEMIDVPANADGDLSINIKH